MLPKDGRGKFLGRAKTRGLGPDSSRQAGGGGAGRVWLRDDGKGEGKRKCGRQRREREEETLFAVEDHRSMRISRVQRPISQPPLFPLGKREADLVDTLRSRTQHKKHASGNTLPVARLFFRRRRSPIASLGGPSDSTTLAAQQESVATGPAQQSSSLGDLERLYKRGRCQRPIFVYPTPALLNFIDRSPRF